MNFEKDIFISYAHIDEKEVGEDLKGWVSDFHETLQTFISQKWGRLQRFGAMTDCRVTIFLLQKFLNNFQSSSSWCPSLLRGICNRNGARMK
jgi:hypothetical protein